MRTFPQLLCLLALVLPAAAQQRKVPPIDGEKHIYKTVGEVQLPLYVYPPDGHKPSDKSPAIVFFFGGGWKSGSPGQFDPQCKHLAAKGMVAVTAEYRVSSRHPVKIEDCIADARSAMCWVRGHADKLGIDPARIASGGGSAGGHLAAAVALIDEFDSESDDRRTSALPDAMVLFNPALAIARNQHLPAEYNERVEQQLADRAHGPLKNVSPLTYAARKQPPCVMFFGTDDRLLAGAEAFSKASKEAGNECRIVTYDGQGHGFFNFGRNDNKYYLLTLSEMDKFLEQHGFLQPKDAQ